MLLTWMMSHDASSQSPLSTTSGTFTPYKALRNARRSFGSSQPLIVPMWKYVLFVWYCYSAETSWSEWKNWSHQQNASSLSLVRIQDDVTRRYTEIILAPCRRTNLTNFQSPFPTNRCTTCSSIWETLSSKSRASSPVSKPPSLSACSNRPPPPPSKRTVATWTAPASTEASAIGLSQYHAPTSFFPYIRRCLDKVLTAIESAPVLQVEDDNMPNIYRECAILCLKKLFALSQLRSTSPPSTMTQP